MKLTPGTSINSGDTVTRQTIFDLVAEAAIDGVVLEADLSSDVNQHASASNPPSSPGPGSTWWDKANQVLRVWHDEIENTGVSLWLAIGPDVFEVEALAAEPIPFGAACILDLEAGHKWVKLPPSGSDLVALGYTASRVEPLKVVGFNNHYGRSTNNYVPSNIGLLSSPVTAASGTWFSLTVAGLVWGWTPFNRRTGADWLAGGRSVNDVLGLVSGTVFSSVDGGFTSPRGHTLDDARGGVVLEDSYSQMQNAAPAYCMNTFLRTQATDTGEKYARGFFFCPRMGRLTNA